MRSALRLRRAGFCWNLVRRFSRGLDVHISVQWDKVPPQWLQWCFRAPVLKTPAPQICAGGSVHMRVKVERERATLEYVRTYLPLEEGGARRSGSGAVSDRCAVQSK